MAKILIKAGGQVFLNRINLRGSSCLHASCHQGRLSIVKALIKAGGQALVLKADREGYSCLHISCGKGYLGITKVLINAGGKAVVFITSNQGGLCLHAACHLGHLAITKALFEAGGESLLLKTENEFHHSCLHIASTSPLWNFSSLNHARVLLAYGTALATRRWTLLWARGIQTWSMSSGPLQADP